MLYANNTSKAGGKTGTRATVLYSTYYTIQYYKVPVNFESREAV